LITVLLKFIRTASWLLLVPQGRKVNPNIKYAFSLLGLAVICAKTGIVKDGVMVITFEALKLILVTETPFESA
jgi:hypothetical protein